MLRGLEKLFDILTFWERLVSQSIMRLMSLGSVCYLMSLVAGTSIWTHHVECLAKIQIKAHQCVLTAVC